MLREDNDPIHIQIDQLFYLWKLSCCEELLRLPKGALNCISIKLHVLPAFFLNGDLTLQFQFFFLKFFKSGAKCRTSCVRDDADNI